ncbi:PREDICTED: histamine H2 receptor-like isoform X3 [Poecilia mexicana]|uniref:histamine H2 receptor-like isoform X3 n=1 Tax=Poecilia mexicana TaxID=48701 RepID=UPI00072DDCFE|nr:PREDICTED: histamine H2 receptor-like isoform X3 [Poecilia mexicana]
MYLTFNFSTSNYSNLSDAGSLTLQELTHRSVKISIIIILGVMVTLGNIAVLLVITSSVAGWSRNSRYFLLSLTAADSAFGLLVMPLNLWYSTLMTRKRTLLLIAFTWCFPLFLLSPITFPDGIIEVHFSTASLVCNPSYSTNVAYTFSLTCLIFFPCSIVMTYANLRVWCAAKRQTLKLRKYGCALRNRHNVAARVLVPVMAAYYTCWTPCVAVMIYSAVSGSTVPEWIEFVVVWLPTSNGFLNCIFYFWINKNFRRKFHLILQRLALAICPKLADTFGWSSTSSAQFVSGIFDNNVVHERTSSVSSTCTLLSLA